ncbi:MAG: LamG domain-containing protein, partial [Limisphaerales bacterium]
MFKLLLTALVVVLPVGAATVAHYKFERTTPNSPVYDLTDSSGNGHHGRVLGQELFELTTDVPAYPGVSGEALDLRGRLDYAVIPHHADFAPSGDWTIEFFVKASLFHQEHGGATNIANGAFMPIVNTNLAYTIMAKENTNEVTKFGSAWAFHYLPATGWVVFTISFGTDRGKVMLASTDLRDGEWHHIAVVFAPSREYEIRLFQDGFLTQSSNIGNVPFSWGDGPIWVGAWARQESFTVKDRNFDGYLDEIRFSNAALNTESFVV